MSAQIPASVLELAKAFSAPRSLQDLETEELAESGSPIALGTGEVSTSEKAPARTHTRGDQHLPHVSPSGPAGNIHGITGVEPSLSTVLGAFLTLQDKEKADCTQPPEQVGVKAGQALDHRAGRQSRLPAEETRSATCTKDQVTSKAHTAERPNWALAPDEPMVSVQGQ